MLELITHDHNLCLLDKGSATFVRSQYYSSCLDLTFSYDEIAGRMTWKFETETREGDHFPILVSHTRLASQRPQQLVPITNWNLFRHMSTCHIMIRNYLERFTNFIKHYPSV